MVSKISLVNPMAEPFGSYRRIDQLKAIAFDCGFGNEDAKRFGKLSKTATWEAMLEAYGIALPVNKEDELPDPDEDE
ncbi:hypothetical protein [Microcoleus sp. OTE_8_concoct_300]|uniref:hypothetical protein n=1 Tax=Microcoleus sp. OTE_8_concoct_300 TaxID=2964710 RepID=UPI00403F2200